MWTALGYIGLLVVLGFLIKTFAQAIRASGLKSVRVVESSWFRRPGRLGFGLYVT